MGGYILPTIFPLRVGEIVFPVNFATLSSSSSVVLTTARFFAPAIPTLPTLISKMPFLVSGGYTDVDFNSTRFFLLCRVSLFPMGG